jgi:hypothetical protein
VQGPGGIVVCINHVFSGKGRTMTVHTTITTQTQHPHRRLVVAAAGLAAAILAGAAVAVAVGTHGTEASTRPRSIFAQQSLPNSTAMSTIMALTPERLTGAFDSRYALATRKTGPTMGSVLASMSPATRRYTEAIMSLTFAQLAAGAAGSP